MPTKSEVVIIGGGVIGASVAYHLAQEKIKAVLLEKNDFAAGSSGACEGFVLMQSKKPGLHLQLALASAARFPALSHELGSEVEYEEKGGLVVIETQAEMDAMHIFVKKQKECGVDLTFLDREQTKEMEPALSEHVMGSTYLATEGQVNPFLLTRAFLRAAEKAGAVVCPHTLVTGIELNHDQVRAVVTNRGKIQTNTVVNAAGALAAEIGRMVKQNIPITPRRGQVLVTEAMPPFIKRCLLSATYIAAKFNPAVAEAGGMGFAVEQTANGNVLVGSTREFAGFDKRTTYQGLNAMAAQILRIIPRLKDLHVIRAFAGLRPYTPDGLPILGKVEGIQGFIMAAGHEGDGITLSPITGQMIAGLIAGRETPFPLDQFKLERF